MPDDSTIPVPAEPAPKGAAGKKTTTRVISIPPTESRPGGVPMPQTIQLKRSITTTINLADVLSPSAPKSSTTPLEGIQQRPPPERKSETTRISLTDILHQPKKPVDSKRTTRPIPELTTVAAPMPPTIQLKRPPTSPITIVPEPGLPPATAKEKTRSWEDSTVARPVKADDKKKMTTHLILDATAAAMPATESKRSTSNITVIPQTIRLKRPGSATMSAPTQAKARTDVIGEAPTAEERTPDMSQAKLSTSRILVEDTTSTPPAEGKRMTSTITTIPGPLGTALTPRTIHLKRPSLASVEEAGAAESPAESPTVQKAKKAETAKIDLPQEGMPIPITQRKTIKIKRTERNVAPRTVTLKHPGTIVAAAPESVSPGAIGEAEALLEEEAPSSVFFALAAAAVVLIACLVYVMAAQAFGPELALPVPASLL